MSGIIDKDRNFHLAKTARSMMERQMPSGSILTALEEENRNYCNPPLTRQEIIYLMQTTKADVTAEEAARAETVRSHILRQEMIRQNREIGFVGDDKVRE